MANVVDPVAAGVYPPGPLPGQTDTLPQQYPPASYRGPTMGAYAMHHYAPLPTGSDPSIIAARQNAIHAQALAYARARFRQMQAVANRLPPELRASLQQAMANPDLAAGWRSYSGQFAQASR